MKPFCVPIVSVALAQLHTYMYKGGIGGPVCLSTLARLADEDIAILWEQKAGSEKGRAGK